MAEFMLLLHEIPNWFGANMSPADLQKVIEEYSAWAGKMASEGRLVGGHKLKDEGGRIMSRDGGKTKVVDGPYVETKEVVGGYYIVKADSYAHAVELAQTCPHMKYGSRILVREIDQLEG